MMNNLIPETDQGHLYQAAINLYQYTLELREPFNLYHPKLFQDGNQWCALYGENLMEGVSGFGDSPYSAVQAFNQAWNTKLPDAGNK